MTGWQPSLTFVEARYSPETASTLAELYLETTPFELRPGITNPNQWFPERPPKAEWDRVRKAVLTRDDFTCVSCGHRALKWMHVHHLAESENNDVENLSTLCVACHAVMHMGRNLQLETIEIWKAEISQVEIVRATRAGFRQGHSLAEINVALGLKKGRRAPNSVEWANSLMESMGADPRAELPKPLCAVFVNFKQWQVEPVEP